MIPFYRVTPALVERLRPRAIVMSGFARSFHQYDLASLRNVTDILRKSDIPTLCICGSHQLLGFVFNGTIDRVKRLHDEPMRKHRPGEAITNEGYHPEYFMENGLYRVRILRTDPLFTGFGKSALLRESHYCEIKKVPPCFRLLASTKDCRIQAIRHEDKPLYGVQFHPEYYSDSFPDGHKVLENFFRIAGATVPTRRGRSA
jgi:GMP synthase (glutamine-hydrolysing)